MTEQQVERLLHELCVDLGFCLPPNAYEALVVTPPSTAEDFAREVFQAEGLDFDTDAHPDIRQAVLNRVAKHLDEAGPLHP
ncbi:hypothetical protein, partial [Brevundimonas sp.]|uniref:hypothetical protein n=1 Tax=Brevundimonas sp. TaxID=1871086 RepID=UPI0025C0F91E